MGIQPGLDMKFDNRKAGIAFLKLAVEKELSHPWSLERMAELSGVSPYHFCREFSRIQGESPINWLTRMRLEYAAAWLKFSSASTAEIAQQCGYESREGFSRAFARKFGCSPQVFRKNARSNLDRLARKRSVQRAEMPVTVVRQEERTVLCVRHTGPYHRATRAFALLGEWALGASVPLADACCVGINYDEPDITPVLHRRYDAGLVLPPPGPIPPFLHVLRLPKGRYARGIRRRDIRPGQRLELVRRRMAAEKQILRRKPPLFRRAPGAISFVQAPELVSPRRPTDRKPALYPGLALSVHARRSHRPSPASLKQQDRSRIFQSSGIIMKIKRFATPRYFFGSIDDNRIDKLPLPWRSAPLPAVPSSATGSTARRTARRSTT